VTPERWQQVKAILADAMSAPDTRRMAFVERACGSDVELRAEVLSLLAAAGSGDGLATAPVAEERDRALQAILATALGQQYEILRPLGQGGMGAVYLARERALERFVAIKVLRPDLAGATDVRERFRREARVAAQLSHPGILPLHTFGEMSGIWYFVMGYVRGVSLAERLRVEGRIASDEAHRILTELAEALECAHRNGVIHRDIKPANILLDEESGRAMLADFGISKVQGVGDTLTGTGVVIGTPRFMSPEQSLGEPTVDERSDLYSLGAVGYTMLAGREPFADVPGDQLTYRRLSHDPAPLRSVAPSVPEELAEVVMRCLARSPDARWPNARSLREALVRAGGDATSLLPEALRDLPTFGPYALLWAAGWAMLAMGSDYAAGDRLLLMLTAILVPVGFTMHIWNLGRHGLGNAGLARVAFFPPEWWGMWWPRALRRPNDLWPRLPWAARLVRVGVSLFIAALPAMILLRSPIESALGLGASGNDDWFVAAKTALILGGAVVTVGGLWWAYSWGLSWAETVRILFGSTAPSSAWTTPAITRLLSPAPAASRSTVRDTPSEYRRAIAALAPSLPAAASTVGHDVAATSRRLLVAIEACDGEMAGLARDASPMELERLTARLEALEADAEGGTRERRELIDLLSRQIELMRQMRVRCELVSQRRARLFNLLRGLWTQLELVRDSASGSPVVLEMLAGRLRGLCAEIEEEIAAPAEAGLRAPRFAAAPAGEVAAG
jgi:hypothetical protein